VYGILRLWKFTEATGTITKVDGDLLQCLDIVIKSHAPSSMQIELLQIKETLKKHVVEQGNAL
jgi:hypothetical protein